VQSDNPAVGSFEHIVELRLEGAVGLAAVAAVLGEDSALAAGRASDGALARRRPRDVVAPQTVDGVDVGLVECLVAGSDDVGVVMVLVMACSPCGWVIVGCSC
jgi:hypothetical protein